MNEPTPSLISLHFFFAFQARKWVDLEETAAGRKVKINSWRWFGEKKLRWRKVDRGSPLWQQMCEKTIEIYQTMFLRERSEGFRIILQEVLREGPESVSEPVSCGFWSLRRRCRQPVETTHRNSKLYWTETSPEATSLDSEAPGTDHHTTKTSHMNQRRHVLPESSRPAPEPDLSPGSVVAWGSKRSLHVCDGRKVQISVEHAAFETTSVPETAMKSKTTFWTRTHSGHSVSFAILSLNTC